MARGQRAPGVFERCAGADREHAIGALFDARQAGRFAEVDQVGQRLELLVDPQADVGRAGQQPRFGPRRAQRCQRVDAARRYEACAVRIGVGQRCIGRQGAQRRSDRRRFQPHARQIEHALAGIEDRPVAGAAAQVARQLVGQLLARRPRCRPRRGARSSWPATSRSPACRSRIASRGTRPSPAAPGAARRPRPAPGASGPRRSAAPCRRAWAGTGCRR